MASYPFPTQKWVHTESVVSFEEEPTMQPQVYTMNFPPGFPQSEGNNQEKEHIGLLSKSYKIMSLNQCQAVEID